MSKRRILVAVVSVAMTLPVFLVAQGNDPVPAPAAPATMPTTAPAALKLSDLAPEVRSAVDKLAATYAGLKSLQLKGSVNGDFDVSGRKKKFAQEFSSSYAAPALFRHEMKDELTVGSTGKQTYFFSPVDSLYQSNESPSGKFPSGSSDGVSPPQAQLSELLRSQNLSLALALSQDPASALIVGATSVKVTPAEDVDGKKLDGITVSFPSADMLVLIDPDTKLIRRVVSDVSRDLTRRGASDVKRATVTTDYSLTKPDAELAQATFDWTPPAGARDASKQQEGQIDIQALEAALIGKPAPDFTLKDLNDKDVKLSDLKGSIVVLDFWATWCPPCVATLPHMDKLAGDYAPRGLKAFAVSLDDDKPTVVAFMKEKNLTIPVLCDFDGKVATQYHATSPPMKFIIGRDGIVKGAFLGAFPATEARFDKMLDEMFADKK